MMSPRETMQFEENEIYLLSLLRMETRLLFYKRLAYRLYSFENLEMNISM
jgi:hypothetical protein